MCRECLLEPQPDRGRSALESGAFVANFAGCGKCGVRGAALGVGRKARTVEEEDVDVDVDLDVDAGEGGSAGGTGTGTTTRTRHATVRFTETIAFDHVCGACGHVVATHEYEFVVEPNGVQTHEMACVLCGKGSRVVLPLDVERSKARHDAQQRWGAVSPPDSDAAPVPDDKPIVKVSIAGLVSAVSTVRISSTTAPHPHPHPHQQHQEVNDDEWS